jgi:Protein of unknown function (DUF2637)
VTTAPPAIATRQRHDRSAHSATGRDRAVVSLLGVLGFALSYSALQQMATAIHVLSPLSYAYPPLVDGFIAYGVRAVLVLRTAPLHARLYAWVLFGAATSASIWANALHALDLNQPGTTTHTPPRRPHRGGPVRDPAARAGWCDPPARPDLPLRQHHRKPRQRGSGNDVRNLSTGCGPGRREHRNPDRGFGRSTTDSPPAVRDRGFCHGPRGRTAGPRRSSRRAAVH